MKKMVPILSLFLLFTVFATAQSEVGLTHHRTMFLANESFDVCSVNAAYITSRSYGAYFANRFGSRFQLRTSLNYIINQKDGHPGDYFGIALCDRISFAAFYQVYKQLELGLSARYAFFNFWKIGIYGEAGLRASTQLNDERERLYFSRQSKEVLSHAVNVGLGVRFQLSDRLFADLEMQGRRYWQHDHLNSLDQLWIFHPGVAIAYQFDRKVDF